MDTLDEVYSRLVIAELSSRYMRGLDRLDKALLASVFHDDATTDYGFIKAPASEFIEFAHNALAQHASNHHMIGQILIGFEDDDTAFGEVYFQAQHRLDMGGEDTELFVSGRYSDRYERRGGIWKIAHRAEVNDWTRSDPPSDQYFHAMPAQLRGARGEDDYSSQFIGRVVSL
ncbi:MAG: nuclear transport factor 2 family protein [Gammaproteobacteria bacterium]|nr:nuclear transport factor 2 family protein [Gammaproteobacteria bacterium]MCY4323933.1 nuclear transport factor 2 family protein [Gammaproteobacteria bacterium]